MAKRVRRRPIEENFYPWPEEYIPGKMAGPLPHDSRAFAKDYFVVARAVWGERITVGPTPIVWDVLETEPLCEHGIEAVGTVIHIIEKTRYGSQKIYQWHYGRKRWLRVLK